MPKLSQKPGFLVAGAQKPGFLTKFRAWMPKLSQKPGFLVAGAQKPGFLTKFRLSAIMPECHNALCFTIKERKNINYNIV
jgi:hypothetical protein